VKFVRLDFVSFSPGFSPVKSVTTISINRFNGFPAIQSQAKDKTVETVE